MDKLSFLSKWNQSPKVHIIWFHLYASAGAKSLLVMSDSLQPPGL